MSLHRRNIMGNIDPYCANTASDCDVPTDWRLALSSRSKLANIMKRSLDSKSSIQLQSTSPGPGNLGWNNLLGILGMTGVADLSLCPSSRDLLVNRRVPSRGPCLGALIMLSKKKDPSALRASGLSSSASENPPDRYSSSDVTSPTMCGWYEAGADGEVMDRECKPGREGMAAVKAPGFIVLEATSLGIAIGRSAKPFWNDVLFEASCRMGRICSSYSSVPDSKDSGVYSVMVRDDRPSSSVCGLDGSSKKSSRLSNLVTKSPAPMSTRPSSESMVSVLSCTSKYP
ncbi:hypothetical protein TOPH_06540 [Tolypocladium ophioglossoides CBS 100239]|uniref:Uncharacterized protein n=1 Tax=Tolypocladium ophioglossoides (strain CBS 100239) TaxID=1163406 RepID=A0A0L0N4J6_TOLOC|nr:hypothetical protein TOPH_06540 [Tolypocladium ophioglossoides CBS 100239]